MFFGVTCIAATVSVLLLGWGGALHEICAGEPTGILLIFVMLITTGASALYWGNEIRRGLK